MVYGTPSELPWSFLREGRTWLLTVSRSGINFWVGSNLACTWIFVLVACRHPPADVGMDFGPNWGNPTAVKAWVALALLVCLTLKVVGSGDRFGSVRESNRASSVEFEGDEEISWWWWWREVKTQNERSIFNFHCLYVLWPNYGAPVHLKPVSHLRIREPFVLIIALYKNSQIWESREWGVISKPEDGMHSTGQVILLILISMV